MADWEELWKKEEEPERPPAPVVRLPPPAGAGEDRYAVAALADETAILRSTPEGKRNPQLNVSAVKLYGFVAAGRLSDQVVHDELRAAALAAGLSEIETEKTIGSGRKKGLTQPRWPSAPLELVRYDPSDLVAPTLSTQDGPSGEPEPMADGFWSAMDVLEHIRAFAYARMTSPWSLLGVSLLRCLATIPPFVVLPPLIGGPGSLNAFIAIVGSSGVGKGATEAAAADAIDFGQEVYTAPVGSGEGIAHQYAHREKHDVVRDRDAVLFTVPEVDTLTALDGRQGSTLLTQLRSAFSGERLGFGYADATKRLPIDRHTYRLGMTVGVQPEKAGPLLHDADGGTPQRFLWLPATDRWISEDPVEAPQQWEIPRQTFLPGLNGFHTLTVPDSVARVIRANHAQRARGEGEALDGHALFAREKVAQALTFLDGRRTMTEGDWELSGVVMAMSDYTRGEIQRVLSRQAATADVAAAQREARRTVVVSETVTEAAVKRVALKIQRALRRAGGSATWSILRRDVGSADRPYFEDAVDRLTSAGQVVDEGEPRRLRLTEAGG